MLVLPLLNEVVIRATNIFRGLSEELIAALAQIKDLKVIGRSSSFSLQSRKEEPKTIGEKLGVSTLLEGTVRKQGDKVRIVAELIKASDGRSCGREFLIVNLRTSSQFKLKSLSLLLHH